MSLSDFFFGGEAAVTQANNLHDGSPLLLQPSYDARRKQVVG